MFEVRSKYQAGWDREGVSPIHRWKENGNQKMTCEVLQNSYFVRLYRLLILAKHIFNYKIVKIGLHFDICFEGGRGMREEDGEKKWKSGYT